MTVFDILTEYRQALLSGLGVTLKLCGIVWVAGIGIGSVIGAAGARWPFTVGRASRVVSFVLSGIPVLVLLFWMHYPLQAMLDIAIDPFITAAGVLTAVNVIAVADVVRSAVRNFPREYVSAAKVCGMSPQRIVLHIQLPLLLRQLVPGLLLLQVVMLQTSLFASLIGVQEIFRTAQRINSVVYRPIEIYTALGGFMLLVCLPLNGLALWLSTRYSRGLSER